MHKNTHPGKVSLLAIGEAAEQKTSAAIKTLEIDLDGKELADLKNLYRKLGHAFSFPDYFGNNLDSLDEMLHDLSWLADKHFLVTLNHYTDFLHKERPDLKTRVLDILIDSSLEAFLDLRIESGAEIRLHLQERGIPFYEIPA